MLSHASNVWRDLILDGVRYSVPWYDPVGLFMAWRREVAFRDSQGLDVYFVGAVLRHLKWNDRLVGWCAGRAVVIGDPYVNH